MDPRRRSRQLVLLPSLAITGGIVVGFLVGWLAAWSIITSAGPTGGWSNLVGVLVGTLVGLIVDFLAWAALAGWASYRLFPPGRRATAVGWAATATLGAGIVLGVIVGSLVNRGVLADPFLSLVLLAPVVSVWVFRWWDRRLDAEAAPAAQTAPGAPADDAAPGADDA